MRYGNHPMVSAQCLSPRGEEGSQHILLLLPVPNNSDPGSCVPQNSSHTKPLQRWQMGPWLHTSLAELSSSRELIESNSNSIQLLQPMPERPVCRDSRKRRGYPQEAVQVEESNELVGSTPQRTDDNQEQETGVRTAPVLVGRARRYLLTTPLRHRHLRAP